MSRQAIYIMAGSIPACAGEPAGRRWRVSQHRVYPRVCGGTWYRKRFKESLRGLSPRVRGNRVGAGEQ